MLKIISNALTICLGMICLWTACAKDQCSPVEYLLYVKNEDNGFIRRQDYPTGAFLEAFYQPPEFISLMALGQQKAVQKEVLNAEIEKNANFCHFFFTIGSNDTQSIDAILQKKDKDNESFDAKKQQMIYQTQSCFSLLLDGRTIPCAFSHAQLDGRINNSYHFILAFELDSAAHTLYRNKNLTLIFNDSIWSQNKFEFDFDIKKISQSPKLKI